ncbi:MAG: DUF6116 family protein [Pseudomonadales bacterium]
MNLPLVTVFLAWARKLRFKQLFFLTGALFIADLFIPDILPFADEILLGLATLVFANWKDGRQTGDVAEIVETEDNSRSV